MCSYFLLFLLPFPEDNKTLHSCPSSGFGSREQNLGTTSFLVFIFKGGCLRGGMAEAVRAGEGISRLLGHQAQAVKLSGRWQNLCRHGLDPEADAPTSAKTLCPHPWPPPSRSPRVCVSQWPDSRAKPCRSAAGSPFRRGPQAGRCARGASAASPPAGWERWALRITHG